MNTTFSPYAELGVRPDVTLQELKQAYRQAVLRYHPDSAVGAANSLKFHAVTEAYKELRAIVDQSPREKESEHQHSLLRRKNQLLEVWVVLRSRCTPLHFRHRPPQQQPFPAK